ncbi:MAG: cyclic nucleotide-binding domain-containing protein [Solirubrobacterales bacterium]
MKALTERITLLKDIRIFKDLSDKQIELVAGRLQEECMVQGTVIIKEFDRGDTMYLLWEGEVDISRTLTLRLSKYDYGQRDKVLTRLTAHNKLFFGETGLLDMGERTATVVAATRCRMLIFHKADFDDLVAQDPELGYKVVKHICEVVSERLRKANEDVLKLTTALSMALHR